LDLWQIRRRRYDGPDAIGHTAWFVREDGRLFEIGGYSLQEVEPRSITEQLVDDVIQRLAAKLAGTWHWDYRNE
jgi:hypothetical protein